MIKKFLRKLYISDQLYPAVNLFGLPWRGKGAILMYHRVLPDHQTKENLDLGLTISCSNFEKQLGVLKSKYKICSIKELIDGLNKNSDKFMIAITFDDGYKDNLFHALPILEKFSAPASIYITTRFLSENVNMWWYELSDVIQSRTELIFEYNKKKFNFFLKNKKQKIFAYENLTKIFINLKIKQQADLMEIITGSKKRKNYSDICLNSKEVKILDEHPLITIGSHGHNHLNLKILNENEVNYEVSKSLEILEDLLKHKISHFCYPYGKKKQAWHREYNIIKKLNFDTAVTGIAYPLRNSNFYSLPRIYVGNNTCEKTLIRHLSGFYNLANKFFQN